jgi:hypothetical protein
VTLTTGAATLQFGGDTQLQYRFQVRNAAGATVADSGVMNGTTWTVPTELAGSQRHTWQVRAESQGAAGPWSSAASFISPDPALISDALTDGRTVGIQRGGHFIPGQGWMSDSLTDGIDYPIPTCPNCSVEFDVTNFGRGEGESVQKDVKWITMGDGATFGDFGSFRDHPWKMHLEQRSDGDGTGMKLIWRNGAAGGGEPGDHTGKVDPAVDWRGSEVYHFVLSWNPSGFSVSVNGRTWFQDGFGGNAFAPGNHTVSLGCWPRGESFVGIIYRNIRIKQN